MPWSLPSHLTHTSSQQVQALGGQVWAKGQTKASLKQGISPFMQPITQTSGLLVRAPWKGEAARNPE